MKITTEVQEPTWEEIEDYLGFNGYVPTQSAYGGDLIWSKNPDEENPLVLTRNGLGLKSESVNKASAIRKLAAIEGRPEIDVYNDIMGQSKQPNLPTILYAFSRIPEGIWLFKPFEAIKVWDGEEWRKMDSDEEITDWLKRVAPGAFEDKS